MSVSKKSSPAQRRVRILFRKIGIWLDAWCLRGYSQDTHDWPSKLEKLRSLKKTSRQVH